ncbi:MAG: PASTA domain-containing protein [Acidobacteriota bacterium]|nr:PASTA domain-containing protein [Pyrinomonadaceae bacterium]MDW8304693.1 PASTA domain-containing protein [Acidobacteriota bacterium]
MAKVAFVRKGISILIKFAALVVLALAFFAGMVAAIWFSLRGEEIKVPEIVGKDFYEGERELENLGLKIKRRSYRYSKEKPNTILEQSPRPGETVKTGQTILVVVAQANPESTEAPATIKKNLEDDLFPLIEDENETRQQKNSNVRRLERTRDIIRNKNANLPNSESNKNSNQNNRADEKKTENKNVESKPTPTPMKTPATLPSGGELRNRRVIP